VVVHRAREALAQTIRLLVVVRQRRHCARLAELVPAGTDILTPDLRASVDRHMRRCEVCKEVGARLTEPDQLLALLPLLPLPLALHAPPLLLPHVPPHHAAALGHTARKLGQTLMQPAALATIAAVVLGGTGLGIALHHGGGAPGGPAAVARTGSPRSGLGTGPGGTAVASGAQAFAGASHGGDGSGIASATPNPAPATTPGELSGDPTPVDVPPIGLGDQSTGHTPPPPGPAPLLDQWVGPVSTPAGPASAHAVVWHPSTGRPPSVTVTAAGQTVGPAPASQAMAHPSVLRLL